MAMWTVAGSFKLRYIGTRTLLLWRGPVQTSGAQELLVRQTMEMRSVPISFELLAVALRTLETGWLEPQQPRDLRYRIVDRVANSCVMLDRCSHYSMRQERDVAIAYRLYSTFSLNHRGLRLS